MLVLVGGGIFFGSPAPTASVSSSGETVTLYKSLTCGCCGGYSSYLKDLGFNVEVINLDDLSSIKSKYGVPASMQSCHTAIFGDYFVEGHVPIEAVNQMLEEKPDIDGIAIPGMPAGSPGMPGAKSGDWTVYSLKNGETAVFKTL
ncbi:MAG: hypothetical protein GOV15_04035 [Candidatus Diapherotrites archaeon]|nr:hypothetical protein [Candidatus Diapherotrites archaeon]